MRRPLGSLFLISLLLPLTRAEASVESQRYLRNGVHFYQIGEYEKAKGYFIALLSSGSGKEQRVARAYLAKPALHNLRRTRLPPAPPVPPPPRRETEPLLEEPELAPERQSTVAEEPASRLHLSGHLSNETAFRISQPSHLSQWRTLGFLAGAGQWSDALSYKVSARLWYDAVYDLTRHYPQPVEDDQKTDGELRDTYVDLSQGDWDVRVGKQQIVWGEAAGLFYADVVNAKDLREFVLPDFESIRIPEWGSDIEYTKNDFHGELIWLPVPEMDKVGRPDSEYAFPVPVPAGTQVVFGPEDKPTQSLENSEAGGRLSYRAGGWDLGVFHLRTWDKSPVYTITDAQPGSLTLTATHPRLTVEGATFAKEIKEVVLKGEFVYYHNKFFQSTDPSHLTGTVPKDFIDYLVGADYVFSNKLDTMLQFSQRIIHHYEPDLFGQKPVRSTVTLWFKRPFFNNTLEPEFLIIEDIGTGDVMARPKVAYKVATNWRWTIGADFFDGPSDGLFGEFAGRDRIYTELRFNF